MGSKPDNQEATAPPPERAPLLGSWGAWYALVLAALAAVIGLFTALQRGYR